ncbi:hypothetical protein NliqN6_1437 [Naganishia liquefaciens]|uniref:Uncharacterized protein n=1 Tax=Naganishia liquefaciens TaxID=104408 RepID=A0A8H3TR19_9TREE|nr:hypothetical protein NliqN6_1437 [Naganishia liquefaciens]
MMHVLHSSKIIGWVMLTGMAISVQVDVPETAAATPATKPSTYVKPQTNLLYINSTLSPAALNALANNFEGSSRSKSRFLGSSFDQPSASSNRPGLSASRSSSHWDMVDLAEIAQMQAVAAEGSFLGVMSEYAKVIERTFLLSDVVGTLLRHLDNVKQQAANEVSECARLQERNEAVIKGLLSTCQEYSSICASWQELHEQTSAGWREIHRHNSIRWMQLYEENSASWQGLYEQTLADLEEEVKRRRWYQGFLNFITRELREGTLTWTFLVNDAFCFFQAGGGEPIFEDLVAVCRWILRILQI